MMTTQNWSLIFSFGVTDKPTDKDESQSLQVAVDMLCGLTAILQIQKNTI